MRPDWNSSRSSRPWMPRCTSGRSESGTIASLPDQSPRMGAFNHCQSSGPLGGLDEETCLFYMTSSEHAVPGAERGSQFTKNPDLGRFTLYWRALGIPSKTGQLCANLD